MLLNNKMYSRQFSATTTATVFPAPPISNSVKQPDHVIVQTLSTNSQSCFLKNESDVDVLGSTGGYELPPGSNIIIPIADYASFYIISASGTQKLQLIYLGG